MSPSLNRAVRLTPPGRGAVACVRLEGPRTNQLVAEFFSPLGTKPWANREPDRLSLGRWKLSRDGEHAEEAVLRRVTEDVVEIQCHGGDAVAEALLNGLREAGVEIVAWTEHTRGDESDPLAAEALIALAKARTERAAGILLDQQQGTLRRELEQIQQEASEGKTESARARTHALLDRARLGLRLTEPFRVALAGRPNVGKSSLVNAWLGYQRSIVFDQPGTTRDVVAATASVDGWLIELSDTAGLRETRDPLEAAGARLTERRLESVDLVVLILDAAEPPTPEDQALLAAWPDALRVANKCDLPAADASRISGSIPVSALTGEGMDALLRAVSLRLVPEPPSPGAAVPFTVGQAEDLCELLDALDGGNVALADQLLTRMTRGN